MALPSDKIKDPELKALAKEYESIPDTPKQEQNEYLIKAQRRFAATEWEQQMYFQFHCAKKSFIELDGQKYYSHTIGDPAEIDISEKQVIWESLLNNFTFNVAKMKIEEKDMLDPKKLDEFKKRIIELKKPVDEADRELFLVCCLHFYGIPRDVALKNKEMLIPFIIGRKYIQQKALAGQSYDDMKNGKATERTSSLGTIVDGLTKDHY